jgi:hypothetical protein
MFLVFQNWQKQKYYYHFVVICDTSPKLFMKNQTEGPGIKNGHFWSTIWGHPIFSLEIISKSPNIINQNHRTKIQK